jgi:hypothetical protein
MTTLSPMAQRTLTLLAEHPAGITGRRLAHDIGTTTKRVRIAVDELVLAGLAAQTGPWEDPWRVYPIDLASTREAA